MKPKTYQAGFYNLCSRARDRESRLRQADKIAYVLTALGSCPLSSATCLDVGCSSGIITTAIASLFARTIGLDYDDTALKHIDRSGPDVPNFLRGDAMCLPVADGSIDVIICAQVYEHVPDDESLVAEMFRVLKPGGIVFFSGPNKLFPIEPHYFLPFLHWLPGRLADGYLRVLGRGNHYYERSRTLWGLRRLTAQFVVRDVSIDVLRNVRLAASGFRAKVLRRVPSSAWQMLLPVFPNYNWILVKPDETE